MPNTIDITELIDIDPDRVDAVGSPANGTDWLILKATKSDDRPDCPTCHGDGKIMGNNRTCPDCKGSGKKPMVGDTEKSLRELAAAKEAGVAASGQPVPLAKDCPTCKGNGKIVERGQDAIECPDCGGSGKDAQFPEDDALNRVDGFGGAMQVGDPRETVDKSVADYESFIKAKYKQADRDKMAASGQAMSDGAYPIADAEDLGKAIHAVGRGGADHNSIRKHVIARAKALNLSSEIPDNWNADGSLNKELIEKDGIVSGPNPFLNGATNSSTTDPNATDGSDADDSQSAPGSPDWEGLDADIATAAATALLEAAELIRQFADREAIEVAAGEGNDIFDTWDAMMALDAVTAAVGMMATLAFHEGVAAQKSTGVAEKAGKRLSTKSVTALAAARDHLTALMGDDDPAKASDDDDATKSQKDILDMTPDELSELVAATVAKAVVETKKVKKASKQDVDNTDSVAGGKAANAKAKAKKPKADMTDLEDEADQGDNDSASTPVKGAAKAAKKEERKAAKAARTPEEIEARKAVKVQKDELRKSQKAAKKVAKEARLAAIIDESVTKATSAVDELKNELENVKKMAAPSNIVKTRPEGAAVKAAERDAKELRIAALENEMRNTSDPAVRAGNREIIKELRTSLTA